jgi:hypothetical protein
MDLRVHQAQTETTAPRIVCSSSSEWAYLIRRSLAKASETAQAGSQYHRTLEQLDAAIVRDQGIQEEEEEEEESEEPPVAEPDVKEKKDEEGARDGPPKTDHQRAQEAEWGLYRSPQVSQNLDDEDEEETDDERRRDTLKSTEEDYMVRPHTWIELMIA